MYLSTHEFGRGEFVWKDLVQVLVIVAGENLRYQLTRLTNVNDPIGVIDKLIRQKLDITGVGSTVETTCRPKRRVTEKAVGNHERIANAQGKSATGSRESW